ncbi:MAG: hypothetical protein JWO75_4141 [Actinomycetia bacterium]|jgi:uncharacterized protein YecT (DUF1311 family)|nr:hypothetical protein [Actinomycetes bacterium]
MRQSRRGLAMAAVSATAIGLLAGCGGSSAPAAGSASQGTAATASTWATASVAGTAAATRAPSAAFVPVTEPFDPGHPARAMSAPATCGGQDTTLAIEQCYEDKTETADAAIDAVRQASFASASAARQAATNDEDSGWLAARATVCDKAYQTGGTIDGINIAGCLLDESTARLDALKGITPPEAVLKSTDSPSPGDLSWYTTPAGTRIAMMSAQGDATGGAIIEWFVIAGTGGFTVNPAQFTYTHGAFTDAGTAVQGTNPSGHRVSPGTEYQFGIDYSHLSADPSAGKGGGWVYAPGRPAAVWR